MSTKLSSYQRLKQRLLDSEMRLYQLQNAVTDKDERALSKVRTQTQIKRDADRACWFGDTKTTAPHAKGIMDQIINGDQKPNI